MGHWEEFLQHRLQSILNSGERIKPGKTRGGPDFGGHETLSLSLSALGKHMGTAAPSSLMPRNWAAQGILSFIPPATG